MYWINYIFKCFIRRIVYLITKRPIIFLVCVLVVFSFWFFSFNESQAVWNGNSSYTDNNNTIVLQYESIVNDFIWRLDNFKNANQYNTLLAYLNRSDLGYYIYYGDFDGTSMLNGMTYTQDCMYIIFYRLDSPNITSSLYETYCGMNARIQTNNNIYVYFELSDDLYYTEYTQSSVQMPMQLYNYRCSILTNYIKNSFSSISTAINDVNNKLDSIENTITSRDDFQAETETENLYNDLSYASSSQDDNSQSVFSFISSFWNVVTSHIGTDDVVFLTVNLPFVNGGVTFRSDMLYNLIKNTLIYTLLQLCYYYVFGMYIVMGTWRLLCWFQQGEFAKRKNIPIDIVMNHMLM